MKTKSIILASLLALIMNSGRPGGSDEILQTKMMQLRFRPVYAGLIRPEHVIIYLVQVCRLIIGGPHLADFGREFRVFEFDIFHKPLNRIIGIPVPCGAIGPQAGSEYMGDP